MNEKELEERKIELQLFNSIMNWEHENKRTKEFNDRQMQDRIKKLIQNLVVADK